ncbi:unnamed protein product [Arctogadus glacialis]
MFPAQSAYEEKEEEEGPLGWIAQLDIRTGHTVSSRLSQTLWEEEVGILPKEPFHTRVGNSKGKPSQRALAPTKDNREEVGFVLRAPVRRRGLTGPGGFKTASGLALAGRTTLPEAKTKNGWILEYDCDFDTVFNGLMWEPHLLGTASTPPVLDHLEGAGSGIKQITQNAALHTQSHYPASLFLQTLESHPACGPQTIPTPQPSPLSCQYKLTIVCRGDQRILMSTATMEASLYLWSGDNTDNRQQY